MNTKKLENLMKQAETEVLTLLLTEVEKILEKGKYESFVMGMGCWFFTDKKDNNFDSDDKKREFKNIIKLMDDYNDAFKMTGLTIWILKDKRKKYDWRGKVDNKEEFFNSFENDSIETAVKKILE